MNNPFGKVRFDPCECPQLSFANRSHLTVNRYVYILTYTSRVQSTAVMMQATQDSFCIHQRFSGRPLQFPFGLYAPPSLVSYMGSERAVKNFFWGGVLRGSSWSQVTVLPVEMSVGISWECATTFGVTEMCNGCVTSSPSAYQYKSS